MTANNHQQRSRQMRDYSKDSKETAYQTGRCAAMVAPHPCIYEYVGRDDLAAEWKRGKREAISEWTAFGLKLRRQS